MPGLLRLRTDASVYAVQLHTSRLMACCYPALLSRAYSSAPYADARTSGRERRRHYTDPLRAPQTGVSTMVGRQRCGGVFHSTPAVTTPPPATNAERAVGMMESHKETIMAEVMRRLAMHGHTVRYNAAGVPVEGSWFLLPWWEQLRLLAAVFVAFCITKAFFDVMRFELLYYGVWKWGYRNDNSAMKRVLYYGSTALLAAGLFFSFNLNFFLSAWVVGRREMAAHMVRHVFRFLLPHRPLHLMSRSLGVSVA